MTVATITSNSSEVAIHCSNLSTYLRRWGGFPRYPLSALDHFLFYLFAITESNATPCKPRLRCLFLAGFFASH